MGESRVEQQTFIDGFIKGWQSVAGSRLRPPDIEPPPTRPRSSKYIHGMLEGIEAAKKKISELH
jgi:hypothetical protein